MDFANYANMSRRGFLCSSAALATLAAFGGASLNSASAAPAERMVIGRPADSNNLDPVLCVGNGNIFIFNLMIEGLLMTTDDGSDIELCLADDLQISEDGLVYTFTVKPDLKFSDGSPVTATDWQWTYDRALAHDDSAWYACVENIDHVECPDDTTVIIYMKTRAANTMANLCIFDLGVQSKAYFDKVGEEAYADCILGTGPYMLKSWEKGVALTLEANPYYREANLPLTKELEFKVVAEDAARMIQLQGGDIDVALDLSLAVLAQLENDPRVEVAALPSTVTRFLAMNTAIPALSDIRVRKALTLATDPQEVVNVVLNGYGTAIGTIFVPSSKYCNHNLKPNTPDIEAAKALLAEAGYDEKNPLSVKILARSGNEIEVQTSMVLMAQWAKAGVNLIIDMIEPTTYSDRMYGMEFETIIDFWSDDIQDPSEFMQWVFDFDSASGFETNFRQPDDMVALNDACNAEIDDAKRVEMYYEMQEKFAEQTLWIPLFTMPWANAIRAEVEGFAQTPLGNYRFAHMAKEA